MYPRREWRPTPRHRRRFGAYGGDHIGIDVEPACWRSDYDDLGPDWSGDMAFHAQLAAVAPGGSKRSSPTGRQVWLEVAGHQEPLNHPHQETTSTPRKCRKSLRFRVTSTMPETAAIAAIWPSANGSVRPSAWRRARSEAW